MNSLKFWISFIALAAASALISETYTVQPEIIDTIPMGDYRRIWGSPDGAIFLQNRSGVEIRRYPGSDNRKISYRSNQKLITSERGNYYAIITYSSFSPTQLQVTGITLYDRSGKAVWTAKDPGCNTFLLCDYAPIAVGISGAEGLAESRLSFFNSDGDLVGNAKVENFYDGRFSDNGEYFFGITGNGSLTKFASNGRQVNDFGPAVHHFCSYDGSQVAVICATETQIFSGTEAVMTWSIPSHSVREVKFSHDNRYVAILHAERIDIHGLSDTVLVGSYSLEDPSYRFFHFDVDPNFSYFVCSASNSADVPEAKNTKGRVLLLDAGAKILWGEELAYEDWSVRYPDVRIDANNRIVSLITPSFLQLYRF